MSTGCPNIGPKREHPIKSQAAILLTLKLSSLWEDSKTRVFSAIAPTLTHLVYSKFERFTTCETQKVHMSGGKWTSYYLSILWLCFIDPSLLLFFYLLSLLLFFFLILLYISYCSSSCSYSILIFYLIPLLLFILMFLQFILRRLRMFCFALSDHS